MYIFEDADYTQHRRWINPLAQSFVIKADIAPRDWDFELLAGFGDPIDRLRKLPHDVGLLRIAKIQAVGPANGSSTGARHIACGFSHGVHGTKAGIEVAPASVAIKSHRESTL